MLLWARMGSNKYKKMKSTKKVFSTLYRSICGWICSIYILLKRSPIFVYIIFILFTKQMGFFLKTSFFIIINMHPFQRTFYRMAEETVPVNSSTNLSMGEKRPPSLYSFWPNGLPSPFPQQICQLPIISFQSQMIKPPPTPPWLRTSTFSRSGSLYIFLHVLEYCT